MKLEMLVWLQEKERIYEEDVLLRRRLNACLEGSDGLCVMI